MIGKVKEELEKHIGEEVFIQYHLGRNKYESYQCVIRELYNNVFLVEKLAKRKSLVYNVSVS